MHGTLHNFTNSGPLSPVDNIEVYVFDKYLLSHFPSFDIKNNENYLENSYMVALYAAYITCVPSWEFNATHELQKRCAKDYHSHRAIHF